jgi:NAD dependent epimerase/dehydratase family enzyme
MVESQRVIPRVLEDAGYQFAHPTLELAFRDLLG